MPSISYIVNVEGAIVRDGHYLMIIRSDAESHAGGNLSFVGGKVEETQNAEYVFEDAIRREVLEEVGVTLGEMVYVQNTHFITEDNEPVVDIVFLCQYQSGLPIIKDSNEVAEILWLSADEIKQHPKCPPWTKSAIDRVEGKRKQLYW